MNHSMRMAGALAWRLAASFGGFYASSFAGQHLQQLRGRSFSMPVSWGISLELCFYTFCLLAVVQAAWATLENRGRRWPAVTGSCLLYIGAALAWCGGWPGTVDRPYRLWFVLGCGVAGLLAPWAMQALVHRVGYGWKCRSSPEI